MFYFEYNSVLVDIDFFIFKIIYVENTFPKILIPLRGLYLCQVFKLFYPFPINFFINLFIALTFLIKLKAAYIVSVILGSGRTCKISKIP